MSAAGALIAYLDLTQKGKHARLARLKRVTPSHFMAIDQATRRNLELTQTLSGARNGSLLSVIDRTVTAAGARELASRLAAPLTDVKAIEARHECGGHSSRTTARCGARLREALRSAPDISRALARLSVGRGGPRDLANLRDGIHAARLLRDGSAEDRACRAKPQRRCEAMLQGIAAVSRLSDRLELLLVDEPPYLARDGGFIRQCPCAAWTSCAPCATNPAASSPGWKPAIASG